MNIPQQNRLLMIVERARAFNNFADCDVIEDAARLIEDRLEKPTTEKDLTACIDYIISAIEYRRGEQAADDIKLLKHEFLAYESMLSAQHYQLTSAIEYFEREANKGAVIRIM